MRVGIITFHNPVNYGALLQAYALQLTIRRLGHDCRIIDYRNNETKYGFQKIIRKQKGIKNKIFQLISLPNYFNIKKKYNKFSEFSSKYLKITKETYFYNSNFSKISDCFDMFLCGSDQIWKPVNNKLDENYFLNFISDDRKLKVAYAPSFGVSKINEDLNEKVYSMLKDFTSISVREKEGQEILRRIGIHNVNVVLDPTFLLKKGDWDKFVKTPIIKEKYIVAYCLDHSKEFMQALKKIKEIKKIKVVLISGLGVNLVKNIDEVFYGGPQDFLNLIKNAEYVFTNSFHAIIFSIIFNKDFLTVKHRKSNSRIDTLLKTFGLESRLVNTFDDISSVIDNMNYQNIDNLIIKNRQSSIEFLKKALNQKTDQLMKLTN